MTLQLPALISVTALEANSTPLIDEDGCAALANYRAHSSPQFLQTADYIFII